MTQHSLETRSHHEAELHTPDCRQLFMGFFILGLTGFGGVLPMARHMLVEKRRWLSAAQFTELLGLCQFLPGGNIINLSVALGMEFRGLRGALSALMGLILAPTICVVLLGLVYARYQNDVLIEHLFAGLAAAAGVAFCSPPASRCWLRCGANGCSWSWWPLALSPLPDSVSRCCP
ncbi:chromate transport protein ChrA [Ewingella americana]